MSQKKTTKKGNIINKISEEDSDILDVLEKPIKTIKKTKKTSSNVLYKKFSINKKESDRINFDEIYNRQKRNKDSDVNFIPQETNTIPSQTTKKISLLIISSLSFMFIIFCFIGLFLYRTSFNKEIINLIDNNKILDDLYVKEKEGLKSAKVINEDLDDIINIYNNHIYWSNFTSFLEKNIVKDVYVKDIFAESNGDIVISFKTNNYENVSKQMLVLQSSPDIVNKVSINEAESIKEDDFGYDINFKLLLELNSKFLLKNE